jgi:hypothetical protein
MLSKNRAFATHVMLNIAAVTVQFTEKKGTGASPIKISNSIFYLL